MISRKTTKQILDGALNRYRNFLAGSYKGYYITIDCRSSSYIVYIHATFDTIAGEGIFESFMKEYQASVFSVARMVVKPHEIKIRIAKPESKEQLASKLNEVIEPVIEKLLECGYVTGCIDCGNTDDVLDCYEISGCHQYLCERCIARIKQNYKEIRAMLKERYDNPPAYNYTIKKMNLNRKWL